MRYRLTKSYFSQPFVIIFCVGLILLTIGLMQFLPDLWNTFLQVIGTSFVAVALTAPISEFFQFQTLSKYMGIVRGARDSGIVRVFESRLKDRISFQRVLEKEFYQANKILFAGIAFPQLFLNRPLPESIDEKMYDINIPTKILLLDPKKENADERAKIETGRDTLEHIRASLRSLESVVKDRYEHIKKNNIIGNDIAIKEIKFEVHLYNFPPVNFMIMTDRTLFLEQYHFGRLPYTRSGDCIGGRTPIIQFSPHSLTYKVMKSHFGYIWKNKSRDITHDLLTGKYFQE